MKAITIKQHFYKYISKAEYAMAYSMVFGSIATSIVNGYSSYLSDRNKRIERLNKKPLNHIWVDYVSYEDYLKIIDRRNWKPSSSKKIEDVKQNNKKDQILSTLNQWLAEQTKQQKNENEINENSLQKLANMTKNEINTEKSIQKQDDFTKENNTLTQTNTGKDDVNLQPILPTKEKKGNNKVKYRMIESVSKIGSLSGKNKANVLPPSRQEIQQPKYFVVQEAGGYSRYNPKQFRLNNQKQNIELTAKGSKQIVGKIAGKNIEKDESIFQSLAHIWRMLIYKDTKKYGQVINSNYDQYGNRIKTTRMTKRKRTSAKRQTQEKEQLIEYIIEDDDKKENQATNELQKQENVNRNIEFLIPTFIIDGNLQNFTDNELYKDEILNNKISTIDAQALGYLEYTLENCWYKKYSQKYNNFINAVFEIKYNKEKQITGAKIISMDNNINIEQQKQFIQDVSDMLSRCDISGTKNLSQDNYNIWGKIKIQFINKN